MLRIPSAPFYKRFLAAGISSRSLSTKNDLNSSFVDPIQDKLVDPVNHASDSLLLEKANALVEKTRQEHLDHRKDFYMKLGEICALLSPRDSFVVRLNSRSVFEEGCMIWQKYEDQEEEMFIFGWKNTDMFDIYDSNCFKDPQFMQFLESDNRYIVHYILSEMEKEERLDGGKGTIAFSLNTPVSHEEGEDE